MIQECPQCGTKDAGHGMVECVRTLQRRATTAEAFARQVISQTAVDLRQRAGAVLKDAALFKDEQTVCAKYAHERFASEAKFLQGYADRLRRSG